MKNSIKSNFIYNTLFQILSLIIPLISMPYVSRILGPNNIGTFSYATATATYFVIFATLGSSIFGQRTIAYWRDDKTKMSDSFWSILTFRLLSSVFFILFYFLYLIGINNTGLIECLVALNIVNVIIDINWFFQGIEEFKVIVFRNLVIKIISLLAVFIFVNSQDDTWIYALITCGSLILGNMTLWVYLPKYIEPPKAIRPFINVKEMFLIFIPTIASQVYMILDKSMIGMITNSSYQNGCYEQSERLARAALTIVTSIGAVILPRIANLYNSGYLKEAKEYLYTAYKIVWAIGLPMVFGFISLSSILMPIYLGNGFELSIPLMQIFSLLIIFVSLGYVTGLSYLIPTGQQNIYSMSIVMAALVNLTFNLFFIPTYGAIGASIASVLAELTGVIIQIGYCITKKQLESKRIFKPVFKYLTASAIMWLSIILIKPFFPLEFWSLVILFLFSILIYFTLLYLFEEDFLIPEIIKITDYIQSHL